MGCAARGGALLLDRITINPQSTVQCPQRHPLKKFPLVNSPRPGSHTSNRRKNAREVPRSFTEEDGLSRAFQDSYQAAVKVNPADSPAATSDHAAGNAGTGARP